MKRPIKYLLAVFVVLILLFTGGGVFYAVCGDADFVITADAAEISLPEDGIVISAEDYQCDCCHSHSHADSVFGRYACFFCKVGRVIRRLCGFDETEVVHKYAETYFLAPTCFSSGGREYECAVCKKKVSFTDSSLFHNPVFIEGKPASCTEEGYTDSIECSLCGTVLRECEVIHRLGHLPVKDSAVAPTCTADGITEGRHCGRCGIILLEQQPVPATGHDFTDGDTVTNLKVYKTGTDKVTADITCYSCKQKFTDFAVDAVAAVGGYNKIYHTLEKAVGSAKNENVYLIKDYTLRENMSVGNGVTLVIPAFTGDTGYFERDDDGFFSKYCADNPTQAINKHSFRVLTVPSGRTVTVQNSGTVLVSAVTGIFGGGHPESYGVTDGYGEIVLGGKINVENGGIFDCSGYVTDGGGEVNLKNGAKMFETYGILYWRGGSYGAAANKEKIFPIDGYEMNYMSAKLNIAYGAVLLGSCKMCASSMTNFNESQYYYCHFKLLGYGDGYLYQLKDGARAERTVAESGRVTMKFYGNVNFGISSISVGSADFKTSAFQAYKVDGNYSYEFYDGTVTCNQKVQFMPGSAMTVGKGATVEITGTGALIFCTAEEHSGHPGYYYYDSRYVGALYPAGRSDAKLYVKEGGKINVTGKGERQTAALAGMVYVDSASSVNFVKFTSSSVTLNVATGPVNGASILASVNAEKYTVPYIKNTLS